MGGKNDYFFYNLKSSSNDSKQKVDNIQRKNQALEFSYKKDTAILLQYRLPINTLILISFNLILNFFILSNVNKFDLKAALGR